MNSHFTKNHWLQECLSSESISQKCPYFGNIAKWDKRMDVQMKLAMLKWLNPE